MRHLEQFGEHATLQTFSADVPGDGEVASFGMKYSGLPDFRVAVRLEELSLSIRMLRSTAARMIRHRSLWPDKGRGALMDIAEAAIVPTKTDVILDPRTGDRTVIAQSADQPPVAIRLTPFEAEILLERLLMLKRLSKN
jgi:hypothetical protein